MTHGRYIPGTDPLAPQPYTAEQREDLVRRARMVRVPPRRHHVDPGIARMRRARLARVGAHYVMQTGCTLHHAARVMCLTSNWSTTNEAIRHAWRKIYPGVSISEVQQKRELDAYVSGDDNED